MKRVRQVLRANRRLWYAILLLLVAGAAGGIYEIGFAVAFGLMWSAAALGFDRIVRRNASGAARALGGIYRELVAGEKRRVLRIRARERARDGARGYDGGAEREGARAFDGARGFGRDKAGDAGKERA